MSPFVIRLELDLSPLAAALLQQLLGHLVARAPQVPAPVAVPEPISLQPIQLQPRSDAAAAPPQPTGASADIDTGAEPDNVPADLPESAFPESPGRMRRASWCTPERDAVIAREWPAGRPTPEILLELLDLPGPPMPGKYIGMRAAYLGVGRPAGFRPRGAAPAPESTPMLDPTPEAPLPAPPPCEHASTPGQPQVFDYPMRKGVFVEDLGPLPALPATSPAPPGPPSAGNIRADQDTIRAWAAQRGLAPARERMDIDAVNRKRVQLGLPPFELIRRHPPAPNGAAA